MNEPNLYKMKMRKLFYMGLESYEARYTLQLQDWNEREFKKHDIDYEQISAGEYKRTISMLGETTDRARAKVKEEVEQTHTLFKDFVKARRPIVDLDAVATGEHWLGSQAYQLKLVDDIRTSDDYLMSLRDTADIFEVEYTIKKKVLDRLSGLIGQLGRGRVLSNSDAPITRLS